jgi:hypothetical protein
VEIVEEVVVEEEPGVEVLHLVEQEQVDKVMLEEILQV